MTRTKLPERLEHETCPSCGDDAGFSEFKRGNSYSMYCGACGNWWVVIIHGTKPTPEDVAREQYQESRDWLLDLGSRVTHAMIHSEYAELAALHRSLATVMRGVQQRDATARGGDAIGDATDDLDAGLTGPVLS